MADRLNDKLKEYIKTNLCDTPIFGEIQIKFADDKIVGIIIIDNRKFKF